MELKKALELKINFLGGDNIIKIDKNGFICLNDLNSFFPNKRLDHWFDNDSTKNFITILENDINSNSLLDKEKIIPEKGAIISTGNKQVCIYSNKGRIGGIYAHKYLAFEFAMWLSPEFKLKVIKEYENGTQIKQNWDIKRIMASENYKFQTKVIKDNIVDNPESSTNTKLINSIIFGKFESIERDGLTENTLNIIAKMELKNSHYIEDSITYDERKVKLQEYFDKHIKPNFTKQLELDKSENKLLN